MLLIILYHNLEPKTVGTDYFRDSVMSRECVANYLCSNDYEMDGIREILIVETVGNWYPEPQLTYRYVMVNGELDRDYSI